MLKEKIKNNQEIITYTIILLILIILVVCNNVFWKLGKNTENTTNKIEYLESNNVTYSVPYDEMVLD